MEQEWETYSFNYPLVVKFEQISHFVLLFLLLTLNSKCRQSFNIWLHLNFENAIFKITFFQIQFEKVPTKVSFADIFSSVRFNASQNSKLQNFEILTRQLCQLASDTWYLVCLIACMITSGPFINYLSSTQISQIFDPRSRLCTHIIKVMTSLKQ